MKDKDDFILFFKIVLGKIASAERDKKKKKKREKKERITSFPKTEATTFAFSSVFFLRLYGASPLKVNLLNVESTERLFT